MNYRDCHLVLFDFRNKITPIPDIEKPITNKIIRDIKSTVPKFICVFNILLKNKSVIIKLPSVLAPKIAIANPKKIKINEIVSFFLLITRSPPLSATLIQSSIPKWVFFTY